MKSKKVSIGFSDRKLHNILRSFLPGLILLFIIIPLALLLLVDLTKKFRILIPISLLFLSFDYLAVTIWVWIKYIRYFGFPSLQACRKMLKLDAMKASFNNPKEPKGGTGDVNVALILLSILFFLLWRWFGFASFLFPATILLLTAIKRLIRLSRPPAVLLLGGSSYDATRLQFQLISIFGSSLVTSGLYHKENATVMVSGMQSDFNSIRTADYNRWQEAVVDVLQLSKIVIIDIRNMTEAVQFEITQATRLVDSNQIFFIGKVAELVAPDRCFEEAELLNELRMKYSPKRTSFHKAASTKVYEDKKNGYFRFIPPEGWTYFERPDPRTKFMFSHPINPKVQLSFIVKDYYSANFASLVLEQKHKILGLETKFGATCQMEIIELAGRSTIELKILAKDSSLMRISLFITNGLHFTITYYAPTKATYDAYLDDINHSLETIEILNKSVSDLSKMRERMSQQEIARELRLAELFADEYDIDEAKHVIAELLRKYPDNKDAQKLAKDLEKLSMDDKK